MNNGSIPTNPAQLPPPAQTAPSTPAATESYATNPYVLGGGALAILGLGALLARRRKHVDPE